MKFWQSLAFTETEQLVDLARICEEVGFHGVLFADHLAFPAQLESKYPYSADGAPAFTAETPFPDPWVTIAAMASVTSRLRFSTIIYVLPLRHPFEVAKQTSTLAIISDDRFALGVGTGWMREEFEALGVPFRRRGARTDEMIEILRSFWTTGRARAEGESFAFPEFAMAPVPGRNVPVYVGGVSQAAFERAARIGDGWVGPGSMAGDVAPVLERIDDLRREFGRASEPFERIVPLAEPLTPETVAILESAGADATVNYPLSYVLGPRSTLEQKRAALEAFAEKHLV